MDANNRTPGMPALLNGPIYISHELNKEAAQVVKEVKETCQQPDFKLRLGDGSYLACHKVVLSASSDFFQAMFVHNLDDAKRGTLDMSYIDSDALNALHFYFYTGKFSLFTGNKERQAFQELMMFFQVTSLIKKLDLFDDVIDDIISCNVNRYTCIHYLMQPNIVKFRKVFQRAGDIIRNNKSYYVQTSEYHYEVKDDVKEAIDKIRRRKIIKYRFDKLCTSEKRSQWEEVTGLPDGFSKAVRGIVIGDCHVVIIGDSKGCPPCARYDLFHHTWDIFPPFPREIKDGRKMSLCVTANKIVVLLQDGADFTIDCLHMNLWEWYDTVTMKFDGVDITDENCHVEMVASIHELYFLIYRDNDEIEGEGLPSNKCNLYLYSIKKNDLFKQGIAKPEPQGKPVEINTFETNRPYAFIRKEEVFVADDKLGVLCFHGGEWIWYHARWIGGLDNCQPIAHGERLLCVVKGCDGYMGFDDRRVYDLKEFSFAKQRWVDTNVPFVAAHFEMDTAYTGYTLAQPKPGMVPKKEKYGDFDQDDLDNCPAIKNMRSNFLNMFGMNDRDEREDSETEEEKEEDC